MRGTGLLVVVHTLLTAVVSLVVWASRRGAQGLRVVDSRALALWLIVLWQVRSSQTRG